MSMFPSPVTPERIEEIRDKHRRLLSSPSYRRNLAACWYHDDIRDLLSALSASQAAIVREQEQNRALQACVVQDAGLIAKVLGERDEAQAALAEKETQMVVLKGDLMAADIERKNLARDLAELEAALAAQGQAQGWQPIETAPPHLRCLVTNNLRAVDANGQMSHIWIGFPIKSDDGSWVVFDDDWVRIHSLTHWMPLPAVPGAGAGEKP